jgi:CRP-like cAMP-binding protein
VPPRPPVPFTAIPILAPLTAEDRAALDPICELKAYEKGAVLFEEGAPALFIQFIFVGRVKIVKAAADRDLILEILGPGEPVGAVASRAARSPSPNVSSSASSKSGPRSPAGSSPA